MVERMRLALHILLGGVPPRVSFGLKKATAIFMAASGRYDDDQSKAVPFAILETAKAMGAEVTLFEELADKKESIADRISDQHEYASRVATSTALAIKKLEAERAELEQAAKSVQQRADGMVSALQRDAADLERVGEFFTIKK